MALQYRMVLHGIDGITDGITRHPMVPFCIASHMGSHMGITHDISDGIINGTTHGTTHFISPANIASSQCLSYPIAATQVHPVYHQK
jgi:hypothetical protein